MNMTNEEILCSFKEAKNPAEQVRILADLNACDVSTIKGVLIAQGVDPRKLPRERQKAPIEQKPSPSPSILDVLNKERQRLTTRMEEIVQLVPKLQEEGKTLHDKMEAVDKAMEVLAEAYGEEI